MSFAMTPPGAFLIQAFDLIRPHPMLGMHFGIRNHLSELVSVPLSSQSDAAVIFCEEMLEAVQSIASPSQRVLRPLEPMETPHDLMPRLFLNAFSTETQFQGVNKTESRIFGAGQYYPFALGRLLGIGKNTSIRIVKINDRAHELGASVSFSTREMKVNQMQTVGFTRQARASEAMETSVRFLHAGFLRRFLGLKGEDGPSYDPRVSFDLALRLSAFFYLSHPDVFREGFVFSVMDEEKNYSFGPAIPMRSWYELSFGPRGGIRLKNSVGEKISPKDCLLEGASFLISSRALESPDRQRAALAIGWNENGFHIEQRRRPGGPPSLSATARLFDGVKIEIGDWIDDFHRLPEDEKIGHLAEYYAVIAGENIFQS